LILILLKTVSESPVAGFGYPFTGITSPVFWLYYNARSPNLQPRILAKLYNYLFVHIHVS